MLDFHENAPKAKGAYFEEKELIKKQIGSLEDVRDSLGLSKRKMCQLLLVDPSAWTKWSKPGQDAPAYIYRSLQWALAIINEHPETHPLALQLAREKSGKLDEVSKKFESRFELHKSILFELDTKLKQLDSEDKDYKKQNQKLKRLLRIFLIFNFFTILVVLGFLAFN